MALYKYSSFPFHFNLLLPKLTKHEPTLTLRSVSRQCGPCIAGLTVRPSSIFSEVHENGRNTVALASVSQTGARKFVKCWPTVKVRPPINIRQVTSAVKSSLKIMSHLKRVAILYN